MPNPFSVNVQNLASKPQTGWVTIGLPEKAAFRYGLTDQKLPVVAVGKDLHLKVEMAPLETRTLIVHPGDTPPPPFTIAPWVSDQPQRLLPRFQVMLNGTRFEAKVPQPSPVVLSTPFFRLDEQNEARQVWHMRTRFGVPNILIEAWFYIYNDQEVVPFEIRASYGTTKGEEPRDIVLGSLSMLVGEMPVIDFRTIKGLHEPVWRPDIVPGQIWWEAELCAPMQWLRTRTVEATGALLCLPTEDRFAQLPGNPRLNNLLARREIPLTAIANVWDGKYGAFGRIPQMPPGWTVTQGQRYSAFLQRFNQTGSELMSRPYAQPANAGQTGEQPDFGASRAEHAVATLQPWAVYDLRYSVQAWMLRPYANREDTMDPILAVNHPNARLWNLRPDERFYGDSLNWPNPVGWIGDWDTSDSQHRSDNLLWGMLALTRSRSIERTALDILELQKLELRGGQPNVGQGLDSPRGWGRPLISLCHAIANGYQDAVPLVEDFIQRAWTVASFRLLPDDGKHSVRVLSSNEDKYGWVNTDGTPIRAWLPWQEGIAIMGFYAAYLQLKNDATRALCRDLCVIPAKTIARHAFFTQGGATYCCYGVRWRTDEPGVPLPDSSYTLMQPNYDIFVFGIQRWVIPALKILLELDPQCQEAPLAKSIIAAYPPSNWDDTCWAAV